MAAEKALSKEYQRKNTKEKEQKRLTNISHSQLFTQVTRLAKITEKHKKYAPLSPQAPCPTI